TTPPRKLLKSSLVTGELVQCRRTRASSGAREASFASLPVFHARPLTPSIRPLNNVSCAERDKKSRRTDYASGYESGLLCSRMTSNTNASTLFVVDGFCSGDNGHVGSRHAI